MFVTISGHSLSSTNQIDMAFITESGNLIIIPTESTSEESVLKLVGLMSAEYIDVSFMLASYKEHGQSYRLIDAFVELGALTYSDGAKLLNQIQQNLNIGNVAVIRNESDLKTIYY